MRLGSLSLSLMSAGFFSGALAPYAVASGQVAARPFTLDEGTYLISRNGAPIGRESFRIVHAPSATGDVYRATAQAAIGEQRIVPSLSCDSSGSPVSYDVTVQGGADQAVRLQARARPGRFSTVVRTQDGESTREYVIPAGVVVLDDDVIHQLYFVTLGGRRSGTVRLLAPRTGTQAVARLENLGPTSVEIAGQSVPATHFVLSAPGFGRREFWTDSAGRILKAAIPDRGLLAQRDELPR
jgi:hypothetical protein